MYDTMRFWTMSAADFLDEYFESEIVKAHLAGSSIIGTALGPRSPGTAYVLLHHYMGEVDDTVGAWGFARGGMGAVTAALAASLQASGGEIRTGAGIERILVRGGRAIGVVLDDGEEIRAPLVVSNMDVKRTFLESVEEKDLPGEFVQQVRNFKIRGSSGKLNIALDGLPEFPAIPAGAPCSRGDMHVTDSLEMMERAYDDWKEGTWSRAPYIDMLIPSQIDPTMAPDGKHYMSVFVQYCPYELASGPWDADKRKAFGDTVIDTIARHSPNFKSLILHAEVRTPCDIENEVGLTEGNIFQGELTMDQLLFNRPIPGYAQYRTPLQGPLPVRLEHASGRRRHGRAGRECRARDPARPAAGRSRRDRRAASKRLRLHRHRRRPQRPGLRGVPGQGRALGAGARSGDAGRRRRRHARVRAGLPRLCLRAPAAPDVGAADRRTGPRDARAALRGDADADDCAVRRWQFDRAGRRPACPDRLACQHVIVDAYPRLIERLDRFARLLSADPRPGATAARHRCLA